MLERTSSTVDQFFAPEFLPRCRLSGELLSSLFDLVGGAYAGNLAA
jgi:hypothetical protein